MLFLIIQSLYFLHSLWSINQNFKNENVEYEIFIFLLDTYLADSIMLCILILK